MKRAPATKAALAKKLGNKSVALFEALRESVALQSHYAWLLNMHDGGQRIIFESAESWMERLNQVRRAK